MKWILQVPKEWMQSNSLLSISVPCIIELYRQEVNAEGLSMDRMFFFFHYEIYLKIPHF